MTYTRSKIASEYSTITINPIADPETTFDFFQRHGNDLFDRWDGRHFTRVVSTGNHIGLLIITVTEDGRWEVTGPAESPALEALVREQFITTALTSEKLFDLAPELVTKVSRESLENSVIVRAASLFQAITRSVTAQMVNLEFAGTVRTHLAKEFGTHVTHDGCDAYWLEPADLAEATVEQLRELQLTRTKSKCIIATARAITSGDFRTEELAELPDSKLRSTLTSIPGIGRWTADWVMTRHFNRPMVAAGDLGVRKAIHWLFDLAKRPSETEVRTLTQRWGEHASIIQSAVLEAYHRA